ncbi:hypothetical protein C7M84_020224 [Penaeus vannamei]|uniref:Uncharacterized protein n=1 Tax=Penaeus vannamei TaxID=6689 RepID=A0A423SCT1_PENVA|nr:hypothetical protein C7M84_020224 [Penaeus vannamei]
MALLGRDRPRPRKPPASLRRLPRTDSLAPIAWPLRCSRGSHCTLRSMTSDKTSLSLLSSPLFHPHFPPCFALSALLSLDLSLPLPHSPPLSLIPLPRSPPHLSPLPSLLSFPRSSHLSLPLLSRTLSYPNPSPPLPIYPSVHIHPSPPTSLPFTHLLLPHKFLLLFFSSSPPPPSFNSSSFFLFSPLFPFPFPSSLLSSSLSFRLHPLVPQNACPLITGIMLPSIRKVGTRRPSEFLRHEPAAPCLPPPFSTFLARTMTTADLPRVKLGAYTGSSSLTCVRRLFSYFSSFSLLSAYSPTLASLLFSLSLSILSSSLSSSLPLSPAPYPPLLISISPSLLTSLPYPPPRRLSLTLSLLLTPFSLSLHPHLSPATQLSPLCALLPPSLSLPSTEAASLPLLLSHFPLHATSSLVVSHFSAGCHLEADEQSLSNRASSVSAHSTAHRSRSI